jgi:hypothetical protein
VIVVLDPLRVQGMKVDSLSDLRLTTQDTDRIVRMSTENLSRLNSIPIHGASGTAAGYRRRRGPGRESDGEADGQTRGASP